jgi:hypothetical protein
MKINDTVETKVDRQSGTIDFIINGTNKRQ